MGVVGNDADAAGVGDLLEAAAGQGKGGEGSGGGGGFNAAMADGGNGAEGVEEVAASWAPKGGWLICLPVRAAGVTGYAVVWVFRVPGVRLGRRGCGHR